MTWPTLKPLLALYGEDGCNLSALMILPERAIFFTTRCATTLSSQHQGFDRTLFRAYHPHPHTTFYFHFGTSGSVRTITLDGYVVNMKKTEHAERTVGQPRDQVSRGRAHPPSIASAAWDSPFIDNTHHEKSLYSVVLKQVDEIGRSVRLFRLEIPRTVGGIQVC